MTEFLKPKVYASKCLGFCACWWNGTTIFSDFIEMIKPFVKFVTHCPEVEIGLGSPRKFIRIVMENGVKRFVQPATDRDLTDIMKEYITTTIESLGVIDGFILRENSPSCSIERVKYYHGRDRASSIADTGPGLFAEAILNEYHNYPIESDGRLRNRKIREEFLTQIFLLSSLRHVMRSQHIKSLIDFHSENKYLIMTYGQKYVNKLGRIVSNAERKQVEEIMLEYWDTLLPAIADGRKRSSTTNVFSKIFGYFSDSLTREEKKYFLHRLEEYRTGRVPLSLVRELLRLWMLRFDDEYIRRQSIFEPYPQELEELADFGEYKKEQTKRD
ncbi:MAG: DUF1722 domain-containing protein [Candidatus Lokiarchaeota archaeon]|nr:DUF1722 domain-containing protein [Candidatus Lokiarchaeota archaeon]